MEPYLFRPGGCPLLVSMPHVGTYLPAAMAREMSEAARGLPDTDWHVDRLYDFLGDLDASVLKATHTRYVIDLNRGPDGKPLYAGASNTELCPTTTFDELPVYRAGQEPDAAAIAVRRAQYWQPYHDRLRAELQAIRVRHGTAVLWDAHSIRSRVPRFFEGRLPDLNLGTGDGVTADPGLRAELERVAAASDYSLAVNGRFKGGYITRAYGRPAEGIHAVQLELSQITYMNENPPFAFREALAGALRPLLRDLLTCVLDWAREQGRP